MGRGEDITDICERYLTRREEREDVKDLIKRCLDRGYDYEKMKKRVLDAVSDSHKANKVIAAVSSAYSQFRKRQRFEESDDRSGKRSRNDHDSRDRDRERERDKDRDREHDRKRDNGRERDGPREGVSVSRKDEEKTKDSVYSEETLKAKELMYRAQQEIEERKRQMGLAAAHQAGVVSPVNVPQKNITLGPQEAQVFINYSLDKKKTRAEELKARIAARAAQSIGVPLPNLVPAAPEETREAPAKVEEPAPREENKLIEYLDPRIKAKGSERRRRNFNFHEKGEFEKLANKQRAMAKLEKLQAEISQAAKSTGISSAVKMAMVTPSGPGGRNLDVPECEWWDTIVLEATSYDNIPDVNDPNRFDSTISELVEHPIKLRAPTDPLTPQYLKVYLTSKERKKIRRQNRKEMQKERTEKIRLGLEKAPEPKVKISNLMRVLGSDAIQDPTKMEAHVRLQMAERLRKHEEANAERKLTDEQRAAKKTKKLTEDTSLSTNVAVYRIKSLANPSKKFKVETNAKQLHMTGVIILHKHINVVVVEGGPKQQKFYKNLLLSRIKWEDEIVGQKKDAEKDAPGERNQCQLIWEGQVKKRSFRDVSVVSVTIEKQARDFFEKHGVAQYWDLAYSTSVLLDDLDPLPI